MPRPETLHGDEEIIEACSLRFYEVLDPHFSQFNGALNLEAAGPAVDKLRAELGIQYNGASEIETGFRDAITTLNDRKDVIDYSYHKSRQ